MVKWHAYGRCKTRLSKDIGKFHSSNVQRKMTEHTVSVAKFLENKGLIDISLANTNSKTQDFFNKNEIVLKKLGRISNILLEDQKKSSASLIIKGELYKMYFEQDVDIKTIKDTLLKKHSKIKDEMDKINTRLSNKSFIDRAPRDIVEQEKSNFNNLEKDAKKIQLTLENL